MPKSACNCTVLLRVYSIGAVGADSEIAKKSYVLWVGTYLASQH